MRKPIGVVTKQGKFVSRNLLEQYSLKQDETSKQISDVFENQYNTSGLVAPLYNPALLAQLLEMNTYHYRACKTKARDTAGLGWSLDSIGDDANEENEHQLRTFFESLSPPLTILFDRAQLDYEAVGWGAIEVVRKDYSSTGEIVALAHVPSHTLRVHQDGNRYAQIRGTKRRWFKRIGESDIDVNQDSGDVSEAGSISPQTRATEIIWWQNYTPRSDFYGLPDVMPALGALHGDLSRRDFNVAFFENYGVPAYAVFITGDFDLGDEDEESNESDFQQAIEQHFRELAEHPHSVLVMAIPTRDEGQKVEIEFHPLSTDIKEASFRLYRADNRDEILAAHGVPPYRAGIAEVGALGGTTAVEMTEIYKRSVIEPRQTVLEDLINRHIIQGAFEITDWRFRFADIDTEDEMHDANLMAILVREGAMWPDEMRAHFVTRFGLDPDRAVPADLAPDTAAIEAALESLDQMVLTTLRKEGVDAASNGRVRQPAH